MMNIGIFHMKKIILAVGAMLTMAVTCFAANPESDFSYDLVTKAELKILAGQFKELDPNEDYVEVLSYKGDQNAELIEIPEEIEGCKVIKISGWIPAQTKKVVVPASVVLVRKFRINDNTTIDFLRAKDLPFAWGGGIRMENWTELPTDRKIIFVNEAEESYDSSRIWLPELETFTWPKNWSCMMYGKPKYIDDKGFFEQGDEKLVDDGDHDNRAFPYLHYKGELRFEEGIEVFPVRMYETSCKIVLPKSMKTVWKLSWNADSDALIKFSDEEKGNIVIPEGAKINFKPGCISGQLSISTKKALHAQGYDTDNN